MDLLKPDDVTRNEQVIVAGYGITYELDKRKAERDLRFTRQNMFMNPSRGLNITIFYKAPYARTCRSMS